MFVIMNQVTEISLIFFFSSRRRHTIWPRDWSSVVCSSDLAEDNVLHYSIVRPEAPNTDDFPVFGNEQARQPERRSRYELHLPYMIALRLDWGGERGMVYFFASQPVAADRCAGYVVIGRNYNLGQPSRVIREFEDTIFGQDQLVVESQRPDRVPFDLAAELHLKFDAVAVAYRKAMRAHGLATSDAAGLLTNIAQHGVHAHSPAQRRLT